MQEAKQAQMVAEQQMQSQQIDQKIMGDGVLVQLKELNANFREAMKLAATNPQIAQTVMEMQPTLEQVMATMQMPQEQANP